jgi:hypothetical protein
MQTPRAELPDEVLESLLAWRAVGIPKRGSTDSRPIAIASVILRAWHKTLLQWLPELPAEKWSEKGVTEATASWLAGLGQAGSEIDLTKAFDTVAHSAADASLRWGGTPACVVDWMMVAWEAPRSCHVDGQVSEPVYPDDGIPAGDPLCCRCLGILLQPWHGIIDVQGCQDMGLCRR